MLLSMQITNTGTAFLTGDKTGKGGKTSFGTATKS